MKLGKADYRMWYGGIDAQNRRTLCMAFSNDGVHWEKYAGNPVAVPELSWEGDQIAPTSVLRVNGLFYLYYWSPGHYEPPKEKRIGLMTSADGIRWERRGVVLESEPELLNEALTSGGSGVDAARVMYVEEERLWRMIFVAFGPHITWNGLAESEDGLRWRKLTPLIADYEGKRDTGGSPHRGRLSVLRAPQRIGSQWTALALVAGEGGTTEYVTAVADSLDRWTLSGTRVLWPNQPGEGAISVDDTVSADDWHYFYYVYQDKGVGKAGLIRAPRKSPAQPAVIWANAPVSGEGVLLSAVYEADYGETSIWLVSDKDLCVRLCGELPEGGSFLELESISLTKNVMTVFKPIVMPYRFRLEALAGKADCYVSAWLQFGPLWSGR